MRKITICFLISLVTLILASCAFGGDDDYKTPNELAEEMQTQIMECFINKDSETLKDFFSEYASRKYNIGYQIEAAFNFIDGEIVSYDEPFSSASGSLERKAYGAWTENIITDKGTEYRISFAGRLTDKEEPDRVGVTRIKVVDMTEEYDSSKSDLENGILYIGESE